VSAITLRTPPATKSRWTSSYTRSRYSEWIRQWPL